MRSSFAVLPARSARVAMALMLLAVPGCGDSIQPSITRPSAASLPPAEPRLSNLDLQTSAFPEPAVVQVYDIAGDLYWPAEALAAQSGLFGQKENSLFEPVAPKPVAPDPNAPDPARCFPLHVYGKGVRVPIRRYRTLRAAEARMFGDLWRQVEFVDSPGNMCHHPAYAFRAFDAQGRLIFETSICWGCGNFYLRRGDGGYHWYGLNSGGPGSQALLAYFKQAVGNPNAHAPGDAGAPPILSGTPPAYHPDALDAFEETKGEPTDADLAALHDFTRLQSLGLFSTEITDRGLATLKTLTGLRTLNLRLPRATDAGFFGLSFLKELRDLDFIEMPVTDRVLAQIANLTKLQGLYLTRDGSPGSPMRGVTNAGLAHLRRLTKLRWLNLSGTSVTDAGLIGLAHLTGLESLTLSSTTITGMGMKNLSALPGLKDLTLEHAAVTDDGLAVIAALPALEQLELEGNAAISDAGMAHLAQAPRLYRLNLQFDAITDAGLKHLVSAPALSHLDLKGTRVTDAAVPFLAAIPKLRAVWVGETRMTEAGIARLNKLRPDVTVQN